MKGFWAYLKKELWEQVVTFKAIIICILFFLLGIISPIGAKYATEVINFLTDGSILIELPDPTYIDAFVQFFKNMSQLGVIVFVIIFSNILGQELAKGTLIIPISKGLTLRTVINAKFVSLLCSWTIALVISFTSCILYTRILFPELNMMGVMELLIGMWFFGIFLCSLIIFSNVICKGGYISLFLVGCCIAVLFVVGMIPGIKEYCPLNLVNIDVASALNNKSFDWVKSGAVTGISIIALLMISNIRVRSKGEYCN